MLTKPNLKDEKIVACLHDFYGLEVTEIVFLPLGADFRTAVYRVTTTDETNYFLKLRSENFYEPSVLVPHLLKQMGFPNIISPIETKTNECWVNIDAFTVTLYPYIEGCNAVDAKLSAQQWQQFGATMKKLHASNIPDSIARRMLKETFSKNCYQTGRLFLKRVDNEVFDDAIAQKCAAFLMSKKDAILGLIERAEGLGVILKNQPLQHVLCHGDPHGWNLLIDQDNNMHLIDWDTLILAPKEKDLMFVGAGIWETGRTPAEVEALFYQGYGQVDINLDALCFYRFHRIIQDIAETCEYLFLSDEGGEDRMQVFEHLKRNFLPNGTIERAYHADKVRCIT